MGGCVRPALAAWRRILATRGAGLTTVPGSGPLFLHRPRLHRPLHRPRLHRPRLHRPLHRV
jgi:hypothetical protein